MEGLRVSKLEEGQQWGKNTSSKDKVHWGRRPPYIVGGTIQPLPPLQPRRERYYRLASGTTACPYKRYYRSPSRYYRWAQSGTTAASGRYYRIRAEQRPPTAVASTVKPDMKKTPRIEAVLARGCSGTMAGGYQWYYRSGAVLPLRPAVLPLGNQNCHNFCI